MGMVERRELDIDIPASVSGLPALQSAFSTLSADNQHKQVISLEGSNDEQLIKVCNLILSRWTLGLISLFLGTTEDLCF